MKCNALRDEIGILIRAGYFRGFLENEPQVSVINERPRQRSPKKIKEVVTIFGGLHVAGESRNARDRYRKETRSGP